LFRQEAAGQLQDTQAESDTQEARDIRASTSKAGEKIQSRKFPRPMQQLKA